MESYLFKKLPILDKDKVKINKDSLNQMISHNIFKEDHQTEKNILLKSIEVKNNNASFKNSIKDKSKDKLMQMKQFEYNKSIKPGFSLDKKELNYKEKVVTLRITENQKNTLNELNNQDTNFFRGFKIKKKKVNNLYKNKEEILPLISNYTPIESEPNVILRNKNLLKNGDLTNFNTNIFNYSNKSHEKNLSKGDSLNKLPKNIIYNSNNNYYNNNYNNVINSINSKSNLKSYSNEIPLNKHRSGRNNIIEKYINDNKLTSFEDKISSVNSKKYQSKNKIKIDIDKVNNLFSNKKSTEIKDNFKRKNTPNYYIKFNNKSKTIENKRNNKINKIKVSKKKIETIEDDICDSFREELNIIITDVNNCNSNNERITSLKNKKIENQKDEGKEHNNDENISVESIEDINICINNYDDDSEEKNIPKEEIERINLIKKFNRPKTSYNHVKN